ncbi:MAG: hypothetical protein K9M49_04475 [Candidatus Marinimicrobia bacterium]|nr:hypothetical protein [Candidatus Neomarinimicrobiota bacterium]MCF7850877.1 hypothetical protein [Candidatus Neomarinimicrobiota bacterium]MCF7904392.1 hypothetical protein [Candidatus Neomarinimicrobiota bacterium]
MNKTSKLFQSIILFALALSVSAGETLKLHVLFTNDIHGAIKADKAWFMNPSYPPDLGGGAAMSAYVNETRELAEENNEAVLLLDGGNFFQGTSIGMSDSGRTMVDWMNKMAYDALVPGIQDFIYGVDNIEKLAERADFPFLAANLEGDLSLIEDYTIIEQQGVRIGIVGITTSALKNMLLPWNTEGITVLPEIENARAAVEDLSKQDVDIIIGLCHLGVPYDRAQEYEDFATELLQESDEAETWKEDMNALEFARLYDGLSVIFSGGTNAGYNLPWEDPVTHTLVYQGYGNGSNIGHAILTFDVRSGQLLKVEKPTYRGNLITLTADDVPPDEEMVTWIKKKSADRAQSPTPDPLNLEKVVSHEITWSTMPVDEDQYTVASYSGANTLEAVTWNMEWFPKASDTTLQAVAELMLDVGADIYAVQEIGKINEFSRLMSYLPGYNFEITRQSSFFDQAIIYNTEYLTPVWRDEPFADSDYNFAGRPPLKVDFIWKHQNVEELITVVDLHMKCCGNGLARRKKAADELHAYFLDHIETGFENIIALGDWNDDIIDKGIEQSFNVFLNDTENFQWATMQIVNDPEQASYPTWPSFLDHILIGKGLFDEFEKSGYVQTLPVEKWLGGWDNYEAIISDHRPVLLRLKFTP